MYRKFPCGAGVKGPALPSRAGPSYSAGSVPGPGTSICCRCGQKKKKKRKTMYITNWKQNVFKSLEGEVVVTFENLSNSTEY